MEEYIPFSMGEICGDFDGVDGDDAVAGLLVDKEQTVTAMEKRYAADGRYTCWNACRLADAADWKQVVSED